MGVLRSTMLGAQMVADFAEARMRAEAIWGKAESERMADDAAKEAIETWTRETPPEILNRRVRERLILEAMP